MLNTHRSNDARGERNIPRDTAKLAERAFHTTSDFPLLLSAAANKMLLAAYQPANPTYRSIFLRRDFKDFKPHRHLRIGAFTDFAAMIGRRVADFENATAYALLNTASSPCPCRPLR